MLSPPSADDTGTAIPITIDREASAYVPYLLDRGGYAMVSHIDRLVPTLSGHPSRTGTLNTYQEERHDVSTHQQSRRLHRLRYGK